MASVLNRTTKTYLESANTPDYPVAEWIINPNMAAVEGYPSKYWVINGDIVTLMSQQGMDSVDAAELDATRDMTASRVDSIEDIIRAIGWTLLDEVNLHASTVTALLDAIDASTSLSDLKTRAASINNLPQRTMTQVKNAVRSKLGN